MMMHNLTRNGISYNADFDWIECTTFSSLLILSALIGVYFGWLRKNQNTVDEYILGGKSMRVFPVAMSLIASHISGITILGIPSEVYEFGTQFLVSVFSTIFVVIITNVFYLPVFFDLQFCSLYEYLEMRFSRSVRLLGSLSFVLFLIGYIPMVIYIPALAFHQITGISVHILTPIISFLCIFYTTIGGLKAVIWTDTIQSLFTLVSIIIVAILGVINVGGLSKVFEINLQGQRLEIFNFDTNPFSRSTFWNVSLGYFGLWIVVMTVHPGSFQRFISLPSIKAAKRSVVWFGIGVVIILCLTVFLGMVIYAKYWNCDPIMAKNISTSGKILPYFVQEVVSFPGLIGFFLAGLISTALSWIEYISWYILQRFCYSLMKTIVVIFGCICVALVYVVEKLGPLIQMSFTLVGLPNGAIFSAFALGIFFPWANRIDVISGMACSTVLVTWMAIGSQMALLNGNLVFVGKPVNTSGCLHNISIHAQPELDLKYEEIGIGTYADKDLFFLYKFSFLFYIPIGAIVGILVGLIVSFLTGGNDLHRLNPNLITPMMRKFLPQSETKIEANVDDFKKGMEQCNNTIEQ